MIQYMIKRIVIGVLSLFVLVGITFFLTRAIPGSPFESSNSMERISSMLYKGILDILMKIHRSQ